MLGHNRYHTFDKNVRIQLSIVRHMIYLNASAQSGPGCSKLKTSFVKVSLKFQTLISDICQYFLLKKCEKLLQLLSFFFLKKSVFGYKVVIHLTIVDLLTSSLANDALNNRPLNVLHTVLDNFCYYNNQPVNQMVNLPVKELLRWRPGYSG